ncbi:basic amino acid ABC transporter substrate-binding protein [Halorhabdus amylolytica]|uniref:basic amino acid ABC transporter substrate-binding protein n=1 Tax=Halorhabdus amylolytica TaxID=2559573 RepID=UPI00145A2DB8|nr:basic amino acid ABC transporter substrate-binding protein [Halorhabdus amylolytica]
MKREFSMDRRAYLKSVGAVGVAGLVSGCQGSETTTEPAEDAETDTGAGATTDAGAGMTTEGAAGTIVPGTAPGFPPFEYRTDEGELVGFDVDLVAEVVGRTDYQLGEWVDMDFGALIGSLNNGEIDLIAAGMTINDKRDQQIDFSDPYWEANQAVIVREDGDFQPSAVGDLSGHRVGAQSGTTGEDQVEGLIEDGTLSGSDYRQYDNYTLAVQDLENGNVDAVVIDVPVAENFAANRAVTIAFTIETGERFGLGLREDDDRVSAINDALAEVRDDGTYDELVAEYFE